MKSTEATCLDCDLAFELGDDTEVVMCSAVEEFRAASHPASCACFKPRKMLTESCVTELWQPHGA